MASVRVILEYHTSRLTSWCFWDYWLFKTMSERSWRTRQAASQWLPFSEVEAFFLTLQDHNKGTNETIILFTHSRKTWWPSTKQWGRISEKSEETLSITLLHSEKMQGYCSIWNEGHSLSTALRKRLATERQKVIIYRNQTTEDFNARLTTAYSFSK